MTPTTTVPTADDSSSARKRRADGELLPVGAQIAAARAELLELHRSASKLRCDLHVNEHTAVHLCERIRELEERTGTEPPSKRAVTVRADMRVRVAARALDEATARWPANALTLLGDGETHVCPCEGREPAGDTIVCCSGCGRSVHTAADGSCLYARSEYPTDGTWSCPVCAAEVALFEARGECRGPVPSRGPAPCTP